MSTYPSFNLIDQPWIGVRTRQGETREVSIREVLTDAADFVDVVSDLPTQTAAIYRLLLAILHSSVLTPNAPGPEQWQGLWKADQLPADRVNAYLDRYRDRFDLLHPQTPFYQVADLHTASGKTSGLKALIADTPNGHQFFTLRAGAALRRISFADAARWLVHCQAFDTSGIKSGAVGDARVKDGKGFPIGTGWVGGLGVILAQGRTLRESLLLNLVPSDWEYDAEEEGLAVVDAPVWERPPHGPGVQKRAGGEPSGPLDILTWQSRRIRLIHDGTHVTGALICNGDPLTPQNRHTIEFSTGWRRSEPQQKKLKLPLVYMPRTHNPATTLWRGLAAILPHLGRPTSGRDAANALAPGVLTWLASLRSDDVLERGYPLRIRAIGARYRTNDSVIDEVIDDVLLLHTDILSDLVLRTHATDAVADADAAVAALVNLAGNLVAAAGGDPDGPRKLAREEAFFALESPYRTWLAVLDTDTDLPTHRSQWQHTIRAVIEPAARQLVHDAGTPAWIGRTVRERHIDTSLALKWFEKALRDALPHTVRTSTSSQPA